MRLFFILCLVLGLGLSFEVLEAQKKDPSKNIQAIMAKRNRIFCPLLKPEEPSPRKLKVVTSFEEDIKGSLETKEKVDVLSYLQKGINPIECIETDPDEETYAITLDTYSNFIAAYKKKVDQIRDTQIFKAKTFVKDLGDGLCDLINQDEQLSKRQMTQTIDSMVSKIEKSRKIMEEDRKTFATFFRGFSVLEECCDSAISFDFVDEFLTWISGGEQGELLLTLEKELGKFKEGIQRSSGEIQLNRDNSAEVLKLIRSLNEVEAPLKKDLPPQSGLESIFESSRIVMDYRFQKSFIYDKDDLEDSVECTEGGVFEWKKSESGAWDLSHSTGSSE